MQVEPSKDSAIKIRRTDRSVIVESSQFRKVVVETQPGVLLFRFDGKIPLAAWAPAVTVMDACIARRHRVTFIGNGAEWDSYGPGYRDCWTKWLSHNKADLECVHLLVRSSMLRMGVQVVNMLVSGVITPYSDMATFRAGVEKQHPGLDLSAIV